MQCRSFQSRFYIKRYIWLTNYKKLNDIFTIIYRYYLKYIAKLSVWYIKRFLLAKKKFHDELVAFRCRCL